MKGASIYHFTVDQVPGASDRPQKVFISISFSHVCMKKAMLLCL